MKKSIEQTRWQEGLTRLAFVLACALVIARATILESLRDTEFVVPGADPVPRSAGASASLVLDLLMCVPALLVLARRAVDPQDRIGGTVAHVLFGLLAIWAAMSTLWASDKFAAAVSSAHLIAAGALFWAATQLSRSWREIRLVAATCFAILLVYTAHGAIYRLVDVPDNIKYWEEKEAEELQRRGWEFGSFQHLQFKKKITSGEMVGFNTSPNTFAAVIVMLGIVSAGVAVQRLVDRDEKGWPAAIIVALLPAIWVLGFTQSKTAFATPLIAATILIAIAVAGSWLSRRRKLIYVAAALGIAVGALFVVGTGTVRNDLYNASLTFRWRYWYGAAKVLEMHPLLGIGWANFGLHYTAQRQAVAAEEVKDPHNLIVRAFVELGVVGGALMIAWLTRLWWELSAPTSLVPHSASARSPPDSTRAARTLLSISLLAIVINALASIDFATSTPGASWYVVLLLLKRLLFFGLIVLGLAIAALRSSQRPELDERLAPWMLYATLAAVAVFFVHNLVDFSLFEPGAMCIFALLTGTALGARTPEPRDRPAIAYSAAAVATLLWLAAAFAVVVPVVIAESRAQRGDELIRTRRFREAALAFNDAFTGLWISNSDYAYRASMAQQIARASPEQVRASLDAAIAANPASVLHYRARASFEIAQSNPNAQRIIADFEKAIELDPNEASAHLDFAEALAKLGLKQRAIDEYRTALRYNEMLSADEPKRMTREKLEQVESAIRAMQ